MDRKPADVEPRPPKLQSGTFQVARPRAPEAGVDYPRDLTELLRLFGSEAACQVAIERLRWPRGWACSRCGWTGAPFRAGRLLGCCECRQVGAITANTAMAGTITPLHLWFRALWEIATQESGTSPAAIQRVVGLHHEHAAWELLTRIRSGMTLTARELLRANVEIGTCYVEVPWSERSDGRAPRPVAVAIATERCGNRLARVRLRQLGRVDLHTMRDFVSDVVAPGAKIRTGSWPGYAALGDAGFQLEPCADDRSADDDEADRPDVRRVAEVLRLWLWGTRSATRDRLDHYLDEFVFRFERRGCARGLLFYHLLRAAIPAERAAPVREEEEAEPEPISATG
jgi:hypothetical protein